jgi:hypothetical protein
MKEMRSFSLRASGLAGCVLAALFLAALAAPAWGAFGEDLEKPVPEFSQSDDGRVTAKLIPRGKRTSSRIDFAVAGGSLVDVAGLDFDTVRDSTVDTKDFRSGMFVVKVKTGSPGDEATVSMASAYFTRSTELWVFNSKVRPPWRNSQAENLDQPERVQELVLTVKDGGDFDSDGKANGEITLQVGPMDSFWGYALGTLFIRFFGIFIVLGLLQVGMLVSGGVFKRLDARRKAKASETPAAPPAPSAAAGAGDVLDPHTAAAIGLALQMHLASQQEQSWLPLDRPTAAAWTQEGRGRLMGDRFQVFYRTRRK